MRRQGISTRLAAVGDAVRGQFPAVAAVESNEEHLQAAVEWIARSQDVGATDGSAAGYNLLLGWADPYPETTGYVVPTLYEYADYASDPSVAERATAMSEWLLTTQLTDGGFPGGLGVDGDPVVFNTGQVLFGLLAAYDRTGRERFRDGALAAADWLVAVQDDDGTWSRHTYKNRHHDYHARVAWALLEAAAVSDRSDQYRATARAALDTVADDQRPNGWFERASFDDDSTAFLHTIAYTARGLFEGGLRLDDERLVAAGKRTADVLLDEQVNRGILQGEFDPDWDESWYYCLPGNAQMAALWLRLFETTGEERYRTGASGTVQFLKRHQSLRGSDPVRGAVPGSYPVFGKYLFLRYPNWGAKFLVDALVGLERTVERSPVPERARATETPAVANDGTADSPHPPPEAVGSGPASGESSEGSPEHAIDGGGPASSTAETERGATDTCRVCLLVDGESVERWVPEAIEMMLDETDTEVTLVVVNEDAGTLSRGNVKRGLKYPTYAALRVGAMCRDALLGAPAHAESVPISDIDGVGSAPHIRTYAGRVDGLWNELPDDVVERIGAESDLVVRRGFGLVRGDVLTATEHGVLSYHHGDPREYRGGPAGLWEYMHGRSEAGAIVQSLTDELDAGLVQASRRIDISDCESWAAVRERLYDGSTDLLARAVETVTDDGAEPDTVRDLGPVYHPPSADDIVRYAVRRQRSR
jgi:hypothetical protein